MIKKLLGILVLGLLWCNVGFAETEKIKLVCLFDEDPTKSIIVIIDGDEVFKGSSKADESYVYEDSITAIHDPTEDTNYGWAIVINRYTGAISYGERLWSKENTYTGKCKKDIKRKF